MRNGYAQVVTFDPGTTVRPAAARARAIDPHAPRGDAERSGDDQPEHDGSQNESLTRILAHERGRPGPLNVVEQQVVFAT